MKRIAFKCFFLLLSALVLIILPVGCTENPFSENIFFGTDGQSVSGTVQLENSADPSGVFVWLKAFNLKTYTDKSGQFTFSLPPKQQSHPGGGLTGYYTIYFYLENYKLVSKQIFLFDGAIDYAKSNLDSKGQFSAAIQIAELVSVHIYLDTQLINVLEYTGLIISADFSAVHDDEVTITTNLSHERTWTSMMVERLDDGFDTLSFIDMNGSPSISRFNDQLKLSMFIPAGQLKLAPGVYRPIPYFYVARNLPAGLIDALGPKKRSFSKEFLNLPIRYASTSFTIPY